LVIGPAALRACSVELTVDILGGRRIAYIVKMAIICVCFASDALLHHPRRADCGFENEPSAVFCGGCGKPIATTAVPAPVTASTTPRVDGAERRQLSRKYKGGEFIAGRAYLEKGLTLCDPAHRSRLASAGVAHPPATPRAQIGKILPHVS
jgi:hypothetical protein